MNGGGRRSRWCVPVLLADITGKLILPCAQSSGISGGKIQSDAKGGGIGRSVGGFIDPTLNWSDIAWLRKQTDLPIGLKGIQTVEVR